MKSAPSRLSSMNCKECGHHIPAPEALQGQHGDFLDAMHRAHHADWELEHGKGGVTTTLALRWMRAWRDLAKFQGDEIRDLRSQLFDARDAIEYLEEQARTKAAT